MAEKFYITTTLPYTNSNPHIGFAAEIIKADVVARWQRLLGAEVIFSTGTDEHGLKIYQQAAAANLSPRDYCTPFVERFKKLHQILEISSTHFIRTSDENHLAAVQEFWRRVQVKGDIYKKRYQVKYCVGCELEKTDYELVDGHCPWHPNRELEIIDEENYFFRFSKYQQALLDFYKQQPNFVLPAHRQKEIINFVSSGLKDFSISRLAKKMPNGVPVPGDPEQVIYVWFDALVNYISVLGWPEENSLYTDFWPGIQVCGKDNLRQQTVMWQAMLLSLGLPPTKQVAVFGFLTFNGEKISKSKEGAIDPFLQVEKYNSDALRLYVLSDIMPFEDGDYNEDNLIRRYNADLANGLGNLSARVATLLEKNKIATNLSPQIPAPWHKDFNKSLNNFKLNEAWEILSREVRTANEKLSAAAPWKLNNQEEIKNILIPIAQTILNISWYLQIFLPAAAEKLLSQYGAAEIKKGESLFPRL
ncbi:MAG: methionine--tRNA ligase [Patescibacteria group bacterium]|nr:methionine--tRNA ligase [Patescibacteria group bacterium]